MHYLIMSRSLTQAQRIAKKLERGGITAAVVKAPQLLGEQGCAYAVSIYRHLNEALALLNKGKLSYGRVFAQNEGGGYAEVKA